MRKQTLIIMLFSAILFSGCGKDEDPDIISGVFLKQIKVPTVTTDTAIVITGTTAIIGGTITNIGGGNIIEHGHCWSISPNPTINNDKTNLGNADLGNFTSTLTGLLSSAIYIRAYAINGGGVAYGNQVNNTTGQVSFWTDGTTSNCGYIKIYVDGNYVGELTRYFSSGTPTCGQNGTLTINLQAGSHTFTAQGTNQCSWTNQPTITVVAGQCLLRKLYM